jgi:hypothetical protein
MKRIITLLFATMFITSSFAQRENRNNDNDDRRDDDRQYNRNDNRNNNGNNNNQNSALLVKAYSQNRFVVSVDNNYEYQSNNNNNGNQVNVGSLMAGNHTVNIYELKRGLFGNQRKQLIYNSVLYFKPGFETTINIDYNGQININEMPLYNNNGGGSCNNGNNGNNGNGWGKGKGKKNKYKKHGNHNDYEIDDNSNNYPTNNRQVSDYDFGILKQYIQKESFDNRRINVAKQSAGAYNFSTAQVREIMSIFSFDDGKLEVAKYFYNRTIDRNNYYQLTDALTFTSNKDALLDFIKR